MKSDQIDRNLISGILIESGGHAQTLAVALCEHFSANVGRPSDDEVCDDNGWGRWVSRKADEALDLIAAELRRAIEGIEGHGDSRAEDLSDRLEYFLNTTATKYAVMSDWARSKLNEDQKREFFGILANGRISAEDQPTYAQRLNLTIHRAERAEARVAELQALLNSAKDGDPIAQVKRDGHVILHAAHRPEDQRFEQPILVRSVIPAGTELYALPAGMTLRVNDAPPARTDQQVVDQTNELAAAIYRSRGCICPEGYQFQYALHPQAQHAWTAACEAQRLLTNTDPEDALTNLEA